MAWSGMDLEVSSEGNQVPTLEIQAQDTPASHPWDPRTVGIPSSLGPGTWEYMLACTGHRLWAWWPYTHEPAWNRDSTSCVLLGKLTQA